MSNKNIVETTDVGRLEDKRKKPGRAAEPSKDPKAYGPKLGEFPPVAPDEDTPQDNARPKDTARGGA